MAGTPDTDEPLYSGELRARADLTLAAILRALLVVLPVLIAAALVANTPARAIAFLGGTLAFVLALRILQGRGHGIFCAHALVFGIIAISTAALATYGSIRAPASVALAAAVTFGGIFLARRTLFIATALSIVALGCVAYAENAGWLPAADNRVTVGHWIIYSGIIAAVALALFHMRSLLFDLVRRLQGELAQRQKAETGQRQSEAHFSAAFTNSPDGILISRLRDGTVVAVNDAWSAVNGFPREAVIGRSVAALGIWTEEDRAAYVEILQREGRVSNFLARLRRADGSMRRTLLSAALIEMDGEPCVMSLGRDVTEQQRAEEGLRDSEHRYRSLFQAAMDCILVISPEGAIIDANEFGCRSLGYTREELIGGTFARILDETKLSRLLPRPPGVKTERRTLRAEQEVRAKDGSIRAVEFTAGPLPDGNLLVVARDVTERRRNEKLLENIAKGVSSQTGAEFFRTLVTALCRELPAHMVFIAETVGRGDRVRTIACCVEGALAENFEYRLAGSPCILAMERRGSVVHPQGVAEQFPEDEGLARRGITGYAGTSLFDAAGNATGILVALTREPIERKEFFISMLEIFAARAAVEIERARADATVRELNVSLERRVRERTAELEAANRDLDSFGYSVSHDLRAPLGALNGFAHLLRTREAERLSEDGVNLLRQLETNATRMTNLVEGLLEFSRLGRKPVTRVAVQMAVLVGDVVDELGAGHRDRRLEFRVGTLADAYGDPVLLRQVWLNLVGNAIKYTRGRDPALIDIGSDPATGEYFVRDNGAGFEMKYAERLFGVFERLHSESEFEGTGIGLAIVQRVVNRHGGMVRGEGRPDHGATFRFTLPAR